MKRMAYLAVIALIAVIALNSCKDDPVKPKDKVMSIKLLKCDTLVVGPSNKTLEAFAQIQNISDSPKNIIIKLETIEKIPEQSVEFCALENCLIVQDDVASSSPKVFAAGDIEKEGDFHLTVNPHGNIGTAKFKFTAYVVDDPEDKIVFYITLNSTL